MGGGRQNGLGKKIMVFKWRATTRHWKEKEGSICHSKLAKYKEGSYPAQSGLFLLECNIGENLDNK